jgi:clumping factor A
MIVVSVVLILVAVTLLVLGVATGSSTLLISSIVASLLAAIALVVGARQAAAMRRSAAPVPEPLEPDIHAGPGPDLPVAEPVGAAVPDPSMYGAAGPDKSMSGAGVPGASMSGGVTGVRIPAGRRGRRRRRDDVTPEPSFADNPPAPDEGLASPTDAKARVANRDDAESALAADAAHRQSAAESDDVPDAAATDIDPDYRRASSLIDGARTASPDENAWRRPAESGDNSVLADEFADPAADDPDDEPLPQAVRPADAVRVARMPAEVLVVDGRPRYHMADCTHLVGRLTEPLPAAEAVELGFSPCGLCRPVDRLVARATHG